MFVRDLTGVPEQCTRCKELYDAVEEVLQMLTVLTRAQLDAFHKGDNPAFMHLDRELENVVGQKERRLGAYREHQQTHNPKSDRLPE